MKFGLVVRYSTFKHANNKGADQTVHPQSLISACVTCINLLESIEAIHATQYKSTILAILCTCTCSYGDSGPVRRKPIRKGFLVSRLPKLCLSQVRL